MPWRIKYRTATETEAVDRHPTPESAIEAACRLIDRGYEVYAIGTASLAESVGKTEIAKIYDMWARVRQRNEDANGASASLAVPTTS